MNNNHEDNNSMKRRNFIKYSAAGIASCLTGFPAIITNTAKPVYGNVKSDLPKKVLGKTGFELTAIGLGSHVNPDNERDSAGRIKQLQAAVDMGINVFDVYEHTYKQFDNVSKALQPVRKNVYISLSWLLVPPFTIDENNITEKNAREVVEHALRRFKTDYIDLYRFTNRYESKKSNETVFETMVKLKEEGKIRALGLAAHYEKDFFEPIKNYNLDYVLVPFNPVMNELKYKKLWPLLKRNNIGIISIKPFASGSLFRLKKSSPQLKRLRYDKGSSFAQNILKYIINLKEITSTIPAMNSVDEMKENLGILDDMSFNRSHHQMLEELRYAAKRLGPSYLPPHYRWLHHEWMKKA